MLGAGLGEHAPGMRWEQPRGAGAGRMRWPREDALAPGAGPGRMRWSRVLVPVLGAGLGEHAPESAVGSARGCWPREGALAAGCRFPPWGSVPWEDALAPGGHDGPKMLTWPREGALAASAGPGPAAPAPGCCPQGACPWWACRGRGGRCPSQLCARGDAGGPVPGDGALAARAGAATEGTRLGEDWLWVRPVPTSASVRVRSLSGNVAHDCVTHGVLCLGGGSQDISTRVPGDRVGKCVTEQGDVPCPRLCGEGASAGSGAGSDRRAPVLALRGVSPAQARLPSRVGARARLLGPGGDAQGASA